MITLWATPTIFKRQTIVEGCWIHYPPSTIEREREFIIVITLPRQQVLLQWKNIVKTIEQNEKDGRRGELWRLCQMTSLMSNDISDAVLTKYVTLVGWFFTHSCLSFSFYFIFCKFSVFRWWYKYQLLVSDSKSKMHEGLVRNV